MGTVVFKDTGTPLARFSSKTVALAMQAKLDGLIANYGEANPTTADLAIIDDLEAKQTRFPRS